MTTSCPSNVSPDTLVRTFGDMLGQYSYSKGREHTHTYFGGSTAKKLSVPLPDRDAFYRAYHRYLESTDESTLQGRGRNSITEKSLAVNFMFADIDLKLAYFEDGRITLETAVQLVRDIIDAFYEAIGEILDVRNLAYPITAYRMFYKCHIHFPGIPVTRDVSKRICRDVESRLSDRYPWLVADKVIDMSVYSSGLRVLGSHKGSMAKPGATAKEANSHGAFFGDAIPFQYFYRIGQLQDDGSVAYSGNISFADLQSTSIICPVDTNGLSVSTKYQGGLKCTKKRKKAAAGGAASRKPQRIQLARSLPSSSSSSVVDDPLPRRRHQSNESDDENIEDDAELEDEEEEEDEENHQGDTDECILHHEHDSVTRYLTEAFAVLGLMEHETRLVPDVQSIKRYANGGIVCAILVPQPCPFAGRLHSRTSERGVPAIFAVLSPVESYIKCAKCDGERIPLMAPGPQLAAALRFTSEFLIRESIREPTHENISEFIFQLLKDEYAATPMADGGNFVWHYYDSKYHRWIRREQIIAAISSRNGPVTSAYRAYVRKIREGGGLTPEASKKLLKQWAKLRFSLGTTGFIRGGLMPLLARKLDHYWTYVKSAASFNNEGFMSNLDDDPRLLGFRNGVWDFKRKVFRAGSPSDFISMSTQVDYVPYDEIAPDIRQGLEEFLRKILPSNECLMYTLREIASTLNGTPSKQRFFIMTGGGANGKSTLVRLLNLALGDYAGEVNITLFTHPRPSADRPTPEIIQIKGKRTVTCSEPNAGDLLYLGTIKWVTGGDRVVARALRENNQSFYLQATFFCLTNDIPPINATQDDFGTWRRITPICFKSRFVENPDPANPNDKLTDPKINEHLETWKGAFVSLLVKLYLEGQADGVVSVIPAEFQHLWRQLQNRNDILRRFTTSVVDPNEAGFTTVSTLWESFVVWKQLLRIRKDVQFDHFESNMIKILGELVVVDGLNGWPVKTTAIQTSRHI